MPFKLQAAEVQVGSAAARQIVLELHSSNRGPIPRRSLDDVLALATPRPPGNTGAESKAAAPASGGGPPLPSERLTALPAAPAAAPHRGARDEVQSSRVERSARQCNGSGRHGPRNEPLRNVGRGRIP